MQNRDIVVTPGPAVLILKGGTPTVTLSPAANNCEVGMPNLEENVAQHARYSYHIDKTKWTVRIVSEGGRSIEVPLVHEPPFDATRLLSWFVSSLNCESIVGDLEERYPIVFKQKGHRSAQLWFWRQVVQSLFPLVIAAIRRASGYEKFIEFYQRKRS